MPDDFRREGEGRPFAPSRSWTLIFVFVLLPMIFIGLIIWLAIGLFSPASSAEPMGYHLYCLKHVHECPPGPRKTVSLTPAIRTKIELVHKQVNALIVTRSEAADSWNADVRFGDCDDYVMTKRRRLLKAGIPAGAMTLSVFKVRGEGHVTLLVHTTGGIFELDNLRSDVLVRRRF